MLELCLIPTSSMGRNVRTYITRASWNDVRRWCYRRVNYTCEGCGETDARMECHETWDWQQRTTTTGIQALTGLKCLCSKCHRAVHMYQYGRFINWDIYKEHLQEVNGWSKIYLNLYLRAKLIEKDTRDRIWWEINLLWLLEYFQVDLQMKMLSIPYHPPHTVEVNFDDVKSE